MIKTGRSLIVLFFFSACACRSTFQIPSGYPPITDLLIDESAFPPRWVAGEPSTEFPPLAPFTSGRNEIEYAVRSYYDPAEEAGRAMMKIQRFRRAKVAGREHAQNISAAFRDAEWQTPWILPVGLVFESAGATQYRVACSVEMGQPECAYIAQYDVYALEFYVDFWNTKVFSYTDMLPILHALDEQMSMIEDLR